MERRDRPRTVLVVGGVAIAAGLALAALAASAVRPLALSVLSRRVGLPVRVDGRLDVRPGPAWVVLRFTHAHIVQAPWAGPGDVVQVAQGEIELPWLALLGEPRLHEVRLEGLRVQLRRDAAGRPNWVARPGGRPAALPRIDQVEVGGGVLDLQDQQADLAFRGSVETSGSGAQTQLRLDGAGRSGSAAWRASAQTPVQSTSARARPLQVALTLDTPAGRSAAQFDGTLSPERGGRLSGRVRAQGPDLHELARATRFPLPRTPPYRLQSQIDAVSGSVSLRGLAGRVGGSDLSGSLSIAPDANGRRLDGALRSRSLRLADLFDVASGGQLTRGPRRAGRLLPDGPINVAPLRDLTGRVHLSAARVQSKTVRSLELETRFDHGRVSADPLLLTLDGGRATVRFVLDGRGGTPRAQLDARLRDSDIATLLAARGRPPLRAAVDARLQLGGAGRSLAEAEAHASGRLEATASSGRLERVQAVLLSADLARGLISLLDRSRQTVAIRCAEADFTVSNGYARATDLGLVTDAGGVTGDGGLDLRRESLDLTLRPAAYPARGLTSVKIQGPFRQPRAVLALSGPSSIVSGALHVLMAAQPPPAAHPACRAHA